MTAAMLAASLAVLPLTSPKPVTLTGTTALGQMEQFNRRIVVSGGAWVGVGEIVGDEVVMTWIDSANQVYRGVYRVVDGRLEGHYWRDGCEGFTPETIWIQRED